MGHEHEQTDTPLRSWLKNNAELSYPDPNKVICIFTDASGRYCSGLGTQTTQKQLVLPTEQQSYEPLASLGSKFRAAEPYCTTFEKEGFAMVQTLEKMQYVFACKVNNRVYTDHTKLLFVFAPLAFRFTLGIHVVTKL